MALSNHKRISLCPGLTMIVGDYAHTVGAAEETQVVTGGKVYAVLINPQGTVNSQQTSLPGLYAVSTSGATTTITINQVAGISAGTFVIIVGTA